MNMNINDVQQQNTQNSNVPDMKKYVALKDGSSDFSYYVETAKTQNPNAVLNEQNQNQQTEEELQIIQDDTKEGNLSYVQSFNAMNEGLFSLGIIGEKNFDKSSDMFKYNLNLSDLTMDDIQFFANITQKTDLILNSFDPKNQTFNAIVNGEGLNISYRSLEVSKSLFIAIDNAAKTGKPVRLDFGNDASVILKISKDGKLSAEFVPNDKAMEVMLRNALPELRAKFDEENIPYEQLNYKNFNQQKNNEKKDKEKKDE